MNYIIEFFNDKHNFWNIGTITCIIILLSICLFDYFTTIKIILIGGTELNPFMKPFVYSPIVLGFMKITSVNIIICLIKIMYDIIQNKFYTQYNTLCIYFAFIFPSIITLIIVIHNLKILQFL